MTAAHSKKRKKPVAGGHGRTSTTKAHKNKYRPYRMRVPQVLWLVPLVLLFGFGSVFGFFAGKEIRTSKLQSEFFSNIGKDISFYMDKGPTPDFFVPAGGPYTQRLGYSYIPFFLKTLESEDYTIAAQMRASDRYQELVHDGFYPIYPTKTKAGLRLTDQDGTPLHEVSYPVHLFPNFESVPKLLVDTLLFIEDRDLLNDGPVTRNPAVEWDRFFYAAMGQVLKLFMPGVNLGGGSTLATQIEKFRFSPGGQTPDAREKIRQIISASLRVYLHGADTRAVREKIVLDYLNSTPLSARQGFGEVNSIGDGMWAWFGRTIEEVTAGLNLPESDPTSLTKKGMMYREVLGLVLAQRRPTYYLLTDRAALDALTDQTLENLRSTGVISNRLYEATRASSFRFLPEPPPPPPVSFLDNKATNALRTHLLKILGLRNLYELDRVDLSVTSTLDQGTQKNVMDFLKKMGDPQHVGDNGFFGYHILTQDNDLSKLKWSVLIYEKSEHGNLLRIQADNIDAPLDMNEGGKLDLGSTAKLRTLITYLEIVGELYRRYAGLSQDDLIDLTKEAPDELTLWATTWLSSRPDASMDEMLQGAMDRSYSANPNETFFTGGGAHTFVNFDKADNSRSMNLWEAMRDSVNLVFVRVMRDIVNYTIAQGPQTKQELLGDPDNPARQAYLERYADKEGQVFLGRYINEYNKLDHDAIMARVAKRSRKGATARTILFRSIEPEATPGDFFSFMKANGHADLEKDKLRQLYQEYPPNRYDLADRAYITGINPIELWLVQYLIANPKAKRSDIMAQSKSVRQQSYSWLFQPKRKGAQDTRIRILLELDAFARIQQRWARLGYPFSKLVPSYATSIGSSADRPGALAELVGILLNDGLRKPMLRFEELHFAENTPFETIVRPAGKRIERVLDPAIARVARAAMMEVVENGTARRLKGAYVKPDGQPFLIGGKTGTGDHRYDEYGPGHRLISSRVVNRTGTIVFFIGDKFFGTVTAHVAGEEAANYSFTSAISAQMLKSLAPILQPMIVKNEPKPAPVPAADPAVVDPLAPASQPPAQPAVEAPKKVVKPPKSKPRPESIEAPATSYDLMMDVLPR